MSVYLFFRKELTIISLAAKMTKNTEHSGRRVLPCGSAGGKGESHRGCVHANRRRLYRGCLSFFTQEFQNKVSVGPPAGREILSEGTEKETKNAETGKENING